MNKKLWLCFLPILLTSCVGQRAARSYDSYAVSERFLSEKAGTRYDVYEAPLSSDTGTEVRSFYQDVMNAPDTEEDGNKYIGNEFIGYYICQMKGTGITDLLLLNQDYSLPVYYSIGVSDNPYQKLYFKTVTDAGLVAREKELRITLASSLRIRESYFRNTIKAEA
jgi:hypothetical protein